ncbi:MAG: TIGR04282 family arsenosugar biosynthesis glycosyltransferase [Burkholderiales bacterium]
MTAADTAVIVFAKAPQPGTVKTRLAPLIGAEGAAALHAMLVKHTLDTVRAASLKPVELHCAPGTDDPFFHYCQGHYSVALQPQVGADLGARMLSAFGKALATHAHVLLVGTDCPALTAHHLCQSEKALREGADAVLVPCEDGGYALIGLTRADAKLFDGIAWGTPTVMAGTRVRLKQLAWKWQELETLWDVDRPEDYERLLASQLLDGSRTNDERGTMSAERELP